MKWVTVAIALQVAGTGCIVVTRTQGGPPPPRERVRAEPRYVQVGLGVGAAQFRQECRGCDRGAFDGTKTGLAWDVRVGTPRLGPFSLFANAHAVAVEWLFGETDTQSMLGGMVRYDAHRHVFFEGGAGVARNDEAEVDPYVGGAVGVRFGGRGVTAFDLVWRSSRALHDRVPVTMHALFIGGTIAY